MIRRKAVDHPDLPPVPLLRGRIIIGIFAMVFGFFGLVFWLVTANLAGAVVAAGQIVVENDIKKIQHQTGGIIGEIRVRDGQRVVAGEVLARLDEIIPRTNLAQVVSQWTQLTGRRARLEAERDDRDTLNLPANFPDLGVEAASVASGELHLVAVHWIGVGMVVDIVVAVADVAALWR